MLENLSDWVGVGVKRNLTQSLPELSAPKQGWTAAKFSFDFDAFGARSPSDPLHSTWFSESASLADVGAL